MLAGRDLRVEDFEVRKLPERDYAPAKELFDTCVVFSVPAFLGLFSLHLSLLRAS